MKLIEFNISIQASKQKVWSTMLHPDTYREWVEDSWPGSFYKGKWEKDEKIRFITEDGSGTLVLVKELQPYNYILCEHIAILNAGGIEDITSKLARDWVGMTERYSYTENGGVTNLKVQISTHPNWEDMFISGWPRALKKLKQISEGSNNGFEMRLIKSFKDKR